MTAIQDRHSLTKYIIIWPGGFGRIFKRPNNRKEYIESVDFIHEVALFDDTAKFFDNVYRPIAQINFTNGLAKQYSNTTQAISKNGISVYILEDEIIFEEE